jgi:3-hydroxyisobutyrate dehydrogenase-like beta-hydroxyacid dehydrogenase
MADRAGTAHPMGSAIKNYYALAEADGRGEDYVPMLADFVAAMNKISLAQDAQAAE